MKKVLIFNDTRKYHHGCYKVMEYLHNDLKENGYTILGSISGNSDVVPNVQMQFIEADLILINGEGTMHHNRVVPHQLLEILRSAKTLGKKTALINTVWQDMRLDQEMKEVLRDTYISVREVLSQQELEKDDIKSDIHLDLSYFNDVPDQVELQYPKELVIGKFFMQKDYRPKGINHIDIFKDDWNTVVNILRGTKWFVTGRHHELYASCKARCYFSALDGNTHKNVGLMKTAGVEIPIESPQLSHSRIPEFIDKCKERKKEYDLLFDWMESQPKWTCAKMSRLF